MKSTIHSQESLKFDINSLSISMLSIVSNIPEDILQQYNCESLIIKPVQQFEELKKCCNQQNIYKSTIIENKINIQSILDSQQDINDYFDEIDESQNEEDKQQFYFQIQQELEQINDQLKDQQHQIDQFLTIFKDQKIQQLYQLEKIQKSVENFYTILKLNQNTLNDFQHQNCTNIKEIIEKIKDNQNIYQSLSEKINYQTQLMNKSQECKQYQYQIKKSYIKKENKTNSTILNQQQELNQFSNEIKNYQDQIIEINKDQNSLEIYKKDINNEINEFRKETNHKIDKLQQLLKEKKQFQSEEEEKQQEYEENVRFKNLIKLPFQDIFYQYFVLINKIKQQKIKIKDFNDAIKEQKLEIENIQQSQQEFIDYQKERIDEKQLSIDQFHSQIQEYKSIIQNKEDAIKNKQNQLNSNKKILKHHLSNISDLNDRIHNEKNLNKNIAIKQKNLLDEERALEEKKQYLIKEEKQLLQQNNNIQKLKYLLSNNLNVLEESQNSYLKINSQYINQNQLEQLQQVSEKFKMQFILPFQRIFSLENNKETIKTNLQELINSLSTIKDAITQFKSEFKNKQKQIVKY